jgi:predicted nuclease with TOPRIM domain
MAIEAIEAEPLPGVGPARDHGHLPVPVPLAEGDAPLPRPEVWLKLAHSKVDSIAIEPTPSSLPSDPSMIDTPTRRRHQKQKSISLTGSQDLSSSLELVQTPAPADVNLTSSTSFELDDVDLSADSPSQAPLNGQPTKRAQLKDMAISLVKGLWGAKKEEVEPEQATPPPPRQPEPVVTAPPTLAAVIPVEAPAPLRSSAVAENSAFSLWALSEQQQREQATRSPVEPPKQSSHVAVAAVVAETSPLPTTSELIARPTTPSSSSSASSADLSKFRAQIDALRTERDEYAMKQSDLEHSQKLMRSENASMQLTLRNMQTSASDAMQRVALLEGENNELKRDKQMLQALVEDLKSALALQQQQNKRVAETPDKKSPASTDRASQLVKAQYEERVRSLQARTEELSASNLTLNDKNEDLKIELEETRDKLSRIETQARNERRELTGKVGELAATNAALEAKLRAYGQTVAFVVSPFDDATETANM